VVNINRRQFSVAGIAVAGALSAGLCRTARAQSRVEKTKVVLAVGGKAAFYYLPLTIAEQLGYFDAEGIDLEIADFPSPVRAQQALANGNADVVCGAFEHLISLHSRHHYVLSFVALGRAPQMAMGVSTKNMPNYRRLTDLKGKKIGIAAPGTGTNVMANVLLRGPAAQRCELYRRGYVCGRSVGHQNGANRCHL
jgi:NitT/TauT family transport system substrate-binding protein